MECSRSAVQCRGMEGMNGWMVARGANELMRWRAHSMLLCAVCGCACRFQRANPNPQKKNPPPKPTSPMTRGAHAAACLPLPHTHQRCIGPCAEAGPESMGGKTEEERMSSSPCVTTKTKHKHKHTRSNSSMRARVAAASARVPRRGHRCGYAPLLRALGGEEVSRP